MHRYGCSVRKILDARRKCLIINRNSRFHMFCTKIKHVGKIDFLVCTGIQEKGSAKKELLMVIYIILNMLMKTTSKQNTSVWLRLQSMDESALMNHFKKNYKNKYKIV